jgi:hypothetical protein
VIEVYDDVRLRRMTEAELVSLRNSTQESILLIQAQLGDRNREAEGQRVSSIEYWQWRRRAVGALNHAVNQCRRVKARLEELHLTSRGNAANRRDARDILCELCERIQESGCEVADERVAELIQEGLAIRDARQEKMTPSAAS